MIKRLASILLVLMLTLTMLNGCAPHDPPTDTGNAPAPSANLDSAVEPGSNGDHGFDSDPVSTGGEPEVRLNIVCTVFPQYDWVHQILGDSADGHELTLLLDNRVDLHSYHPSVDDIVRISTCDLFVYVGGESDGWVEDVLLNANNSDMIVIMLMDVLGDGVKMEEAVHGADDGANNHDHHHHDEGGDEDEHDDEEDEHVWLSLNNAMIFCTAIADALSSLNADSADMYESNLASYIGQLSTLDAEYHAALDDAPIRTLLFADRFPFRYLLDDYGLSYFAAFPGCSAETEASFSTIVFLAGKVNELNLHTVLVTESADQSIADTVIDNTREKNQQILVLDAMQSITRSDLQNGATYLSIMESNLDVLKEALR